MTNNNTAFAQSSAYEIAQSAKLAAVLGLEVAQVTTDDIAKLYEDGVEDGFRLAQALLDMVLPFTPAPLDAALKAAITTMSETDAAMVLVLLAEHKADILG